MRLQRSLLIVLAAVFAVSVSVLAYFYDFLFRPVAAHGMGLSDACVDQQSAAAKTNPNKMLFISCGGFFD